MIGVHYSNTMLLQVIQENLPLIHKFIFLKMFLPKAEDNRQQNYTKSENEKQYAYPLIIEVVIFEYFKIDLHQMIMHMQDDIYHLFLFCISKPVRIFHLISFLKHRLILKIHQKLQKVIIIFLP